MQWKQTDTCRARVVELLKARCGCVERERESRGAPDIKLARYMEQQEQETRPQVSGEAAGSGQNGGQHFALAHPVGGQRGDATRGIPQPWHQVGQTTTATTTTTDVVINAGSGPQANLAAVEPGQD